MNKITVKRRKNKIVFMLRPIACVCHKFELLQLVQFSLFNKSFGSGQSIFCGVINYHTELTILNFILLSFQKVLIIRFFLSQIKNTAVCINY